ncbi:MAG: hypothetical protein Q8Q97_03020 [bacterium]|nr:hypothetical protein [bacterium]
MGSTPTIGSNTKLNGFSEAEIRVALGAAHEKVGKIPESQILEYLYDFGGIMFRGV